MNTKTDKKVHYVVHPNKKVGRLKSARRRAIQKPISFT